VRIPQEKFVRILVSLTAGSIAAFICTAVAHAAEEEISFKSDYQQEVKDEQILLLQGHVEVHFRDSIIYADEVRLNDEKDEFFGVGNVRLVGTDRDIFSDSIWYNYARDEFDMRNARGSLMVQGVSELTWFEAGRLTGNINDYLMLNGRVTTCTPEEHREYHIEARTIKVLPGNKIIFRNGYFFIMNLPVMWFPYWAFSLEETPWVIEAGKDNFSGVYVKTRYNYLDEELIIGSLILQYFSRKGWLFGADHSYVLPRQGTGSVRWTASLGTYRGSEGQVLHANTYNVNLAQQLLFGKRFTGNVSFAAGSSFSENTAKRTNTVNGTATANYNTANGRTSLNFNGRQTSGAGQTSSLSAGLSHNRNILEDITSSFKFDYRVDKRDNSGPADEDFQTHAEFRQNLKGWNWSAIVDSHWDPDSFTYLQDRNKAYTDKLPEIHITFQPNAFPGRYRDWLGFQMQQLDLVGALLYIGPEKTERQGFYGRMETRFTRNDKIGTNHTFQSNIDYWQAIASTGDARYNYNVSVNWNWNISTKLRSQMGWTRADEEGRIPFQGYDRPGSPSNRLSYNLSYQNGSLYTVRMNTSYELRERYQLAPGNVLQIKRLQPLSLSVNYTPSRSTSLTLSTSYNVATGDLADLRWTYNTTDDRSYKLQSNITYQPKQGNISQLSASSNFIVGKDWDFEVSADFIGQGGGGIIRELQVTHRLDCSFMSFSYRSSNEDWSITWGISAFPQAHLGYSTTETAFGPGFFNTFGGTGSGFTGGGFNFGGGGGNPFGTQY
jgi:hypothetical protein